MTGLASGATALVPETSWATPAGAPVHGDTVPFPTDVSVPGAALTVAGMSAIEALAAVDPDGFVRRLGST
ncbi:MAG: hypothetical protein JOZ49_07695 [Mycolicibacterium sp.]|nr:hypothetical protein [Mycolicibacterium sp.]